MLTSRPRPGQEVWGAREREARQQWVEAVAVLLGWMNFIRQGTGQFPEIGSPENGGQGTSGLAWLLEMHPTMGNGRRQCAWE